MAQESFTTYSMPLEVYFQSAIVRGILVTNQDRLSNYFILREGEEVFTLRDATLEDLNGKPMRVDAKEYLIYMRQVSLIADLSPQFRVTRSGLEHLYVKKESSKALLGIGPYGCKKDHLTRGSIHDLLMAKTHFCPGDLMLSCLISPMWAAHFLVNRTLVSCIAALRDD
jgi:hypothetical protein